MHQLAQLRFNLELIYLISVLRSSVRFSYFVFFAPALISHACVHLSMVVWSLGLICIAINSCNNSLQAYGILT